MSSPEAVKSQIIDAISQAHNAGGDITLAIIAKLLGEIASCLEGAKQGQPTIDDLSDAFEYAEVEFHSIIAKLATGRD